MVVVVVVVVVDRFKLYFTWEHFLFFFVLNHFRILSSLKIKSVVFQHRGIVKTRNSLMCARK